MHGRLVDNLLLKRSVQLTCSLVTIFYWSWTYKLLWHSKNVSDRCWPECGVLISSTSYSGFYLSLVQLIAWAEDTYISSTLRFPYCVFDTEKFILSKWWEHTAGNSWRRVWLSWNVWWRGYTLLWILDIEMHWHCEDNDQICSSYLSESLCDEMFRSCEDNTYIIIIVIYRSYLWSWTMPFIASKSVVVLRRLWSSRKDNMRFCLTLWISYYSGRKTTAIQLYLADLHWECGTECLTSM